MSEKPSRLLSLVVDAAEVMRLDKYLTKQHSEFSRAFYQEHITQGLVQVNHIVRTKVSHPVKHGDLISVQLIEQEQMPQLQPEPIPLNKIYEDDSILIINKPRGMVVHPAPGHYCGTVVHAILYEVGERLHQEFPEEPWRPGIIHRLDKDTSGLLITAKTRQAKALYGDLFAQKMLQKTYVAICKGHPKQLHIRTCIMRHPTKRKEMAVHPDQGKEAITRCEVLAYNGQISFVLLFPETGRTHQLRVHMKHIGCPILGDPVYGCSSLNSRYHCNQQLLHAYSLVFTHPQTQRSSRFLAPLPDDISAFIQKEFHTSKSFIYNRLSQFN